MITVEEHPSIVDGIAGNIDLQTITFPIIQKYVDEVVLVSEDEIKAAIHGLLSREKLVAEGSAAAAFAAVATGKIRMNGAAVAVITGGNIILQNPLHPPQIPQIWRAHLWTPVTATTRMAS